MGRLNVHHQQQQQQTATTISHFSHSHALHLTNLSNQSQTLNPYNFPCSACKLPISNSIVYSCHLCKFFLHPKCTQMPRQIKHPFDQNNNHVFSLLPVPPYPEGFFKCDACGKQGNGFSYHCPICKLDLHLLCSSMPLSSSHPSHHHELRLSFFSPYPNNAFSCDVCKNPGSASWLYRCHHCNFDVHLDCATPKVLEENPVEITQQSRRNITVALKPGQVQPTPSSTPTMPGRSPDMMNIVAAGFLNGGFNALGQHLVSNMIGGGGGGDGGGSGVDILQGGGGGGLDLSSLGGGGGGMDPTSLFGGMDMVGGLGGF